MLVIERAGLDIRRLEFHEHVVTQPNQETATVDVLCRVVKFEDQARPHGNSLPRWRVQGTDVPKE